MGSSPIGHPNSPPAAFDAAVGAALEQIEASARGALSSDDPEFVHQLRVGLRRLRSALRAFRDLLPPRQAKRLRRALRDLSPGLGKARDWDVLLERLAAAHAAPKLVARAEGKRQRARSAARRALASKAFARVVARTRSLEAQETRKTLAEFGAVALSRAQRKLLKEARGVDWLDPAQRHAMRIRVKRLRYSCEFFAPAFPARRVDGYLADLKALQAILGQLNDVAVGRRLIGFDADEDALLTRLDAAWTRFAQRPAFWRAAK